MSRAVAAAASTQIAAEAARAALEAGLSAADALVAGFFAFAGASAAGLFAPSVALLGGLGVGARAFDGRALQPGRGAPRPRGLASDLGAPAASRAALGRTVEMLALVHGYHGRSPFADLLRAGGAAARAQGAGARERLLSRIGAQGVGGVRSDAVVTALVATAGAVAGGALTPADVAGARPADGAATALDCEPSGNVFVPPWDEAGHGDDPVEVLVVADAHGAVGALAFAPPPVGVAVEALEVALPLAAVPVRRGIARVRPGTPLAMRAPIALASKAGSWAAFGLSGGRVATEGELCGLGAALSLEPALSALKETTGSRGVFAAVIEGRTARAVVA